MSGPLGLPAGGQLWPSDDDDDDDILTKRRSGSKLVLERLHRCLAPGETCGR